MNANTFRDLILKEFPFIPTDDQLELIDGISKFIFSDDTSELLLLKGYAGTGKTTVISAIVKHLWRAKKKSTLLAPTGRAAKVISSYSKQKAFTIHRRIYKPKASTGFGVQFVRQKNTSLDTIFFVDEASMISDTQTDGKTFASNSLLDDFMEFISEGRRCKLILIGDEAQLPPVHLDISPALDKDTLYSRYDKKVIQFQLKQVLRQEADSGILRNATLIRHIQKQGFYDDFKFDLNDQAEVIRLNDGYDIESAIHSSYDNAGIEETTIIVRSNKRANLYNQQIRSRIRMLENEVEAGDILMVVKNNYFWLESKSAPGFIANGDTVEVLRIKEIKELYGFRFAEVELQLVDYPEEKSFESVIMLDTLYVEAPSLPYEETNRLYTEVNKDYEEIKSKAQRYKKVKENPYFNALQVKFAYAVTCHKSQGGQWANVFVEQAWLPDGIDLDYLRWLYTAITRAKEKVYLIGFSDEYFELEEY
ncbi:MAG: AAA family ATPase [Flavobacteriales bacterium]|nr:AAA family ATPase [Flavobacteriales bacterium]